MSSGGEGLLPDAEVAAGLAALDLGGVVGAEPGASGVADLLDVALALGVDGVGSHGCVPFEGQDRVMGES